MIDMKCQHCDQGFRAIRRSAKYCSGRCRQAAKRLSVTVSVTEADGPQPSPRPPRQPDPKLITYLEGGPSKEEKPKSRVARDVAAAKRYLRAMGVDLDE